MKVVVIDPVDEVVLHNVPIESKAAVRRVDEFWRNEEADRGRDLDRILIMEGTSRLMPRSMEIPVPVFPVLVRGGGYKR